MEAPASPTSAHLTAKGAATRVRIVEAAADLILARGVGGTTLDDVRAGTATSKGQLFHYFPNGKQELISAIAALQSQRVLDAQRPYLDTLQSWAEWCAWRDALVAHYRSQPHWGCPIGTLTAEMAGKDPQLAAELGQHMERWRGYLEAGVRRLVDAGEVDPGTDPRAASLAIFAAIQGGLLLTQSLQSIEPLEAAVDAALAGLGAAQSPLSSRSDRS